MAVDVGYGQLAWPLRTDPRVTVLDRVNVRALQPGQVAPPPGLVTADLSFISLKLVLAALVACAAPDADFVLMVKPQFEVGKGKVGSGGVVRDPQQREAAISGVAQAALELGLGVLGVAASPLPGRRGTWSISCGCAAPRRRSTARPSAAPSWRDLSERQADRAARCAHWPAGGTEERTRGGRAADSRRDRRPHSGR